MKSPVPKPFNLICYDFLDKWNEPLVRQKLKELYDETLRLADDKIKWYWEGSKSKGRWARIIRFSAVILFLATTCMPYLSILLGTKGTGSADHNSTDPNTACLYAGYILAGIGGAILMLDKFLDITSSWTRFVLVRAELANLRNAFVANWQAIYFNNVPLTPEGASHIIEGLITFQTSFQQAVKTETEAWAKEFQQSLQELSASIKAQADNFKTEINKQKAENITGYAAGQAQGKDFSSISLADQFTLAKQVIAENQDIWQISIKNYTGVAVGKKVKGSDLQVVDANNYCIQFSVIAKETLPDGSNNGVPVNIFAHGYRIPTDVIATGLITAGIFSGENLATPKPPGVSIGRVNVNSAGTLGPRVQLSDGSLYGMSCYHVLFPEEFRKRTYEIKRGDQTGILNSTQIISPGTNDGKKYSFPGDVSHGKISKLLDVAFFSTDDTEIDKQAYKLPLATEIYDLQDTDEKNLHVKFCGRTSGNVDDGVVFNRSSSPTIVYFKNTADEIYWNFFDVIQLQIKAGEGDSGALVLTHDNKLLGLLFAVGTGDFAWAISMRSIDNNYHFSIA